MLACQIIKMLNYLVTSNIHTKPINTYICSVQITHLGLHFVTQIILCAPPLSTLQIDN